MYSIKAIWPMLCSLMFSGLWNYIFLSWSHLWIKMVVCFFSKYILGSIWFQWARCLSWQTGRWKSKRNNATVWLSKNNWIQTLHIQSAFLIRHSLRRLGGVELHFFFQLIMTLSGLVVSEPYLPSLFADLLHCFICIWIWIYFPPLAESLFHSAIVSNERFLFLKQFLFR